MNSNCYQHRKNGISLYNNNITIYFVNCCVNWRIVVIWLMSYEVFGSVYSNELELLNGIVFSLIPKYHLALIQNINRWRWLPTLGNLDQTPKQHKYIPLGKGDLVRYFKWYNHVSEYAFSILIAIRILKYKIFKFLATTVSADGLRHLQTQWWSDSGPICKQQRRMKV